MIYTLQYLQNVNNFSNNRDHKNVYVLFLFSTTLMKQFILQGVCKLLTVNCWWMCDVIDYLSHQGHIVVESWARFLLFPTNTRIPLTTPSLLTLGLKWLKIENLFIATLQGIKHNFINYTNIDIWPMQTQDQCKLRKVFLHFKLAPHSYLHEGCSCSCIYHGWHSNAASLLPLVCYL